LTQEMFFTLMQSYPRQFFRILQLDFLFSSRFIRTT